MHHCDLILNRKNIRKGRFFSHRFRGIAIYKIREGTKKLMVVATYCRESLQVNRTRSQERVQTVKVPFCSQCSYQTRSPKDYIAFILVPQADCDKLWETWACGGNCNSNDNMENILCHFSFLISFRYRYGGHRHKGLENEKS